MSQAPRPRLALAPVAPYLDRLAVTHGTTTGTRAGRAVVLAALCGVSRRVAHRWHAAGELPEHHADTLAARLDLHPLNLWPEWADLTEGATP